MGLYKFLLIYATDKNRYILKTTFLAKTLNQYLKKITIDISYSTAINFIKYICDINLFC